MKRVLPVGIALLFATLSCAPGALAKPEHSGGKGQDAASDIGSAASEAHDQVNGHGNDGPKDTVEVESPAGKPGDAGGGPASKGGPHAAPPASTDQDAALDAVESGKAVPLENIVSNVEQTVGGQVLDAHQFTIRGFLVYEIKVLEANGKVKNLYYYARSGLPVGR